MQAYARAVALIVPAMVSLTLLVVLWRRNNKRGGASKPFYTVVEEEGSSKAALLGDDKETPTNLSSSHSLEQPLVIAMVGLPARGKSYIVKMMCRYLNWIGFETCVFNIGAHRRSLGLAGVDNKFFRHDNEEGKKIREQMAVEVQGDMYKWLKEDVEGKLRIAIFDATNTSRSRRKMLLQRAKRENVFLLFVESICTDEKILRRNYELKLQNDDYKGMEPGTARRDFIERVKAYEAAYEPIEDEEDDGNIAYVKVINVGQKTVTRLCTGYVPSQVGFYLQNIHINPRKIWLSLYAESMDSVQGIVGGDSGVMTESGRQYSLDIARFIQAEQEKLDGVGREVLVLAGTQKVHTETVVHLRMLFPCYQTALLNELRGGDFHGMSREQICQRHPNEYEKRQQDKLRYRYPGPNGESYMDVVERVRPVIIELERQRRSVVVVCHLAVIRCIFAYFTGTEIDRLPYLQFDMHKVYELTPGPFGCESQILDPNRELSMM